ncbi:bifunctional diguanylate cyclase/phosphodiesterase [Rhodoferax antarcticus]|uniref:Putative diguanylate cyclase with PAS/PAC sensor n=2 Tax=Rhodoferax antarcticus TaxID=81479 RepID=A0A1Q8Y9K5_9BURK|nr:diguanylate cyclase [Rhodoferax antarcticus]MCW2312142.1 diguanylate cyclase (GGDEF)-like protein/PAS domain S-box-containing protein [Rhodoferax antarcticus]OLP04688.1 putative diguanylate cyclase with PAS/PAC sensor [Rhodoferax antarcticus ANT.BR]
MQPGKRQKTLFFAALTAFVVGVLVLTCYILWLMRSEALAGGFQVSALMSRSFESSLTQSLSASAQATANAVLEQPEAANLPQAEAQFLRILRGAPQLRSLSLMDERGRIVASSSRANVGREVDTADYWPQTPDQQQVLRIGAPWTGRDFSEGQSLNTGASSDGVLTLIPVTLPLPMVKGGWRLLVALNPDYFVNQMSQQLASPIGAAEVLRLDGMRLWNTDPQQSVGVVPYGKALAQRIGERDFGQFEDDAGLGQPSMTAFRVSTLYPFAVVTHLRRDAVLERWQTEAKNVLGVMLVVLTVLCALAVAFYRRQSLLQAQRAESARLQQINAACVFTNIREGILITQTNGSIIDVNEAFCLMTGYSRLELLGKNPRILKSGRQDKGFYEAMWRELLAKGHWQGEIWNRHKNGEVFVAMLNISAVPDSHGQVQQYVAVFHNITENKMYQDQLERLARYDALTDMPNRVLLADRLRQAMSQALRHQQLLGVVFIDLDGFKAINDQFGHEAGDQVLISVSSGLRRALRDGDTLARNGGDEFVALLAELQSPQDAESTLRRLLEAASQPILVADQILRVSVSMGVSFYPQANPSSADELLHEADMAMYQAKVSGKNQYRLSMTPMPQASSAREQQRRHQDH